MFFNLIFILHWSTVDLQRCVRFRVQPSDSVVHVHVSILSQVLPGIGCYRMPKRAPCAIQEVLVGYLSYIQEGVYVNHKLLIYLSLPTFAF